MINEPEYYDNWKEKNEECNKIEQPLFEALHKRLYGKYGIEYSGF